MYIYIYTYIYIYGNLGLPAQHHGSADPAAADGAQPLMQPRHSEAALRQSRHWDAEDRQSNTNQNINTDRHVYKEADTFAEILVPGPGYWPSAHCEEEGNEKTHTLLVKTREPSDVYNGNTLLLIGKLYTNHLGLSPKRSSSAFAIDAPFGDKIHKMGNNGRIFNMIVSSSEHTYIRGTHRQNTCSTYTKTTQNTYDR